MQTFEQHPQDKHKAVALDRWAIVLSGICLLHCLALPFAVLLGPVLGQWLLDTETNVHWLLLALALPISFWALRRGYKSHRSLVTLTSGSIGLLLMFLGVSHLAGELLEVPFTVVGVVAVMFAHIRNTIATLKHH
ncbi:MAG: MerC family mercury resistance protein [Pseudomonadales bacterium]|nr:MerC family mercury resistance protein [Pseudomonadales bacterium]